MNSDSRPVGPERGDGSATGENIFRGRRDVWMRGLWMLAFAVFFAIAETVLLLVAVVQFLWMLLAGRKNDGLAEFGTGLGRWLHDVALFQSAASEARPFPWGKWGEAAGKDD